MKRPLLRPPQPSRTTQRENESGVTMVLVAISMIAIIGMATLSIDVVSLYLDREEAQRAADAAALSAARIISLSGITGTGNPATDTTAWQAICGPSGTATQVAQQVGALNAVSGGAGTVTVTYSAQGGTGGVSDCSSGLGQSFAVNPSVTVKVQRTGLPTMFSRYWSRSPNTVSATATAEAFNSSDSLLFAGGGEVIPVVPRCVKPIILPDEDPGHPGSRFARRLGPQASEILNRGIHQVDGTGVIGESFNLQDACGTGGPCALSTTGTPPTNPPPAGYYIPALVNTSVAPVATPSCATDQFQTYVAGCDVGTVYACGTVGGGMQADLTQGYGSDITGALQCLTHVTGPDSLDQTAYPWQITAGTGNPIFSSGQLISSSDSIITLPLYDNTTAGASGVLTVGTQPQITIVGYLQVFVNSVTAGGTMNVTVLNVSGCGENASTTLSAPGTSPVPIRLITPQ